MRVIEIEEHWLPDAIDRRLRSQPAEVRDESLAFNERGDTPARLADLGEDRLETMDRAGVDVQILSVVPPGTNGLPAPDAIALSRDANDEVAAAISEHPTRLGALTTVPWAAPAAAAAELERSAALGGHVGVMAYGRCGDRPLDDPAFDVVFETAARLGRPMLVHPQIPSARTRAALYGDLSDPTVGLGLATFGWGWHIEAGLAVLRLIVTGVFDRHPDLQVICGHWGEMVLFALDRVESLCHVTDLQRPVHEYFATNIHITSSGMLVPRLLRHALDFTTIDRILLSGDYPFHPLDGAVIDRFLATLTDPADRARIAHGNAEALFDLGSAAR